MQFLPRPILFRLHENARKARGHGSAYVGFRVVACHHDVFWRAPQSFDGEVESRDRNLKAAQSTVSF